MHRLSSKSANLTSVGNKALEIGETLPDWQVQTADGQQVTREQFFGQPLLILFYHLGCLGCIGRALPFARKLAVAYPDLQIVGIHTRFEGLQYNTEDVLAQAESTQLPFPIFFDKGHRTYDMYGAEGTPHWILLDANGQLFRSIFGSMANARQRLDYALMEIFQ